MEARKLYSRQLGSVYLWVLRRSQLRNVVRRDPGARPEWPCAFHHSSSTQIHRNYKPLPLAGRLGDAIWINYKGEDGQWHSKTTGYRKSNPGERRQAELLRDKQTLRERTERPTVHAAGWDWVDSWLESRWGSSEATTPKLYRSEWKTLQKWLAEIEVKGPATLRREQCQQYPQWRKKNNAEQNTAIGELKFLGQVMKEAVTRQLAQSNPAAALGLKKASSKEKRTWTDKELSK